MVAPTAAPGISMAEESMEDIVQLMEAIESLSGVSEEAKQMIRYSLTGHLETNKHPPSSTVVDDSHSSKDKQRSSVGLGSCSTIEGNVSTGQSAQQNGHHFAETINSRRCRTFSSTQNVSLTRKTFRSVRSRTANLGVRCFATQNP